MRTRTTYLLAAGVILAALSCDSTTEPVVDSISFLTGNGAPSGSHYNLNIIGVPFEKTADMTGDNGHRIFVLLDRRTKIMLEQADDFGVYDADGTDGTASFRLPGPCPSDWEASAETCEDVALYSVWVRALGGPDGKTYMGTCATDPVTGEEVCPTANQIEIKRKRGKSTFERADRYLLYVNVDLDGDGTVERYPLFDDDLEDYYWSYDNHGLKLLQMRFYRN